MFRFPLLLVAAIPAAMSTAAQDAPPQVNPVPERILPPIDYSLPPGEGQQQPTPVPTPTTAPPRVTPTPTPTARETPTPRATPTPRTTPTPRATETPRPEATPTPVPTPSVTAPMPVETPVAAEMPTAPPVAEAAPVNAAPAATDAGSGPIWWIVGGVLALAALAFWFRRRRANNGVVEATEVPVPAAAPTPAVAPVPPPAPRAVTPPPVLRPAAPVAAPPAAPRPAQPPEFLSRPAGAPLAPRSDIPAGTITAFRAATPAGGGTLTAFSRPAPQLGIELQPIRAGLEEGAGFCEFQFAILNQSDQAVTDMLVSAWMLTASAEQDERILAHLAEPVDPAQHSRYALRPQEHREHRAAMGATLDQLNVVEAAGRRFFAPIILVDARYRGEGGGQGRSSAAFMVGRPNPTTGKLIPLYVDRGSLVVEGLTARPYPIRRPQAA